MQIFIRRPGGVLKDALVPPKAGTQGFHAPAPGPRFPEATIRKPQRLNTNSIDAFCMSLSAGALLKKSLV
jgi:hypothetical protein